jgi:5'-deoxynucleotidase YfbR-like HD superfamily hydrolase
LPNPGDSGPSNLNADEFLQLMNDLALQPYQVERATTVPFDDKRRENDAEHSFSLGIAALCLAPLMNDQLDVSLVCAYALVHDLEEIYAGDTPIYSDPTMRAAKAEREKAARIELNRRFGGRFPWLTRYIEDYAALSDNESKFVYALDKILPHATVILGRHHPAKPTMSAYLATEHIAREKISTAYPELMHLFNELCDRYVEIPGLFSPEPGGDGADPAGQNRDIMFVE